MNKKTIRKQLKVIEEIIHNEIDAIQNHNATYQSDLEDDQEDDFFEKMMKEINSKNNDKTSEDSNTWVYSQLGKVLSHNNQKGKFLNSNNNSEEYSYVINSDNGIIQNYVDQLIKIYSNENTNKGRLGRIIEICKVESQVNKLNKITMKPLIYAINLEEAKRKRKYEESQNPGKFTAEEMNYMIKNLENSYQAHLARKESEDDTKDKSIKKTEQKDEIIDNAYKILGYKRI